MLATAGTDVDNAAPTWITSESILKKAITSAFLALAGTVLCGAPAMADQFNYVVNGGVSVGGDDWQVAKSANGDPVTVHGGGKVSVGGGVYWAPAAYPVGVQLTANYAYDGGAGASGKAKFERVPVEAMFYYTGLKTVRFGVGAGYIVSPEVKADYDGSEHDIKFKNTTNSIFEMGYLVLPNTWLSMRLSSATFKPKNGGNAQDADVTELGARVSYQF